MGMLRPCAILLLVVGLAGVTPQISAQDENQEQEQEQVNKNKTEAGTTQRESVKSEQGFNSISAYRLEFTMTEFDGTKKINTRSYALVVQAGAPAGYPPNKVRIGGRIPVQMASSSANMPAQWQYFDIGMNIDCTVKEQNGAVLLNATIENSSMAPQVEETTHQPIVRQMKTEVRTVLSPGKPTLIVSLDDPTTKGKFQAEVVATKVR